MPYILALDLFLKLMLPILVIIGGIFLAIGLAGSAND